MREESRKFIENAERQSRADADPFGKAVDHMVKVHQTQAGIIEAIQKMADVMAEAAIATRKALGDSEGYAIDRWTKILADRAKELVKDKLGTAAKKIADNSKTIENEGEV
jgi:hypothetical protein